MDMIIEKYKDASKLICIAKNKSFHQYLDKSSAVIYHSRINYKQKMKKKKKSKLHTHTYLYKNLGFMHNSWEREAESKISYQ